MNCENCKYWKRLSARSIYMDGSADIAGSCMYLVDGKKIRGLTKPEDKCKDHENN